MQSLDAVGEQSCALGPVGLGLGVFGGGVTLPSGMQTGDPAFQGGDLLLDFGVETRQLGDHLVQGPEIHFDLFVAHGVLPSQTLSRRPRVPESTPARSGSPHPALPDPQRRGFLQVPGGVGPIEIGVESP